MRYLAGAIGTMKNGMNEKRGPRDGFLENPETVHSQPEPSFPTEHRQVIQEISILISQWKKWSPAMGLWEVEVVTPRSCEAWPLAKEWRLVPMAYILTPTNLGCCRSTSKKV